jgi:RecA/RadA recombinase
MLKRRETGRDSVSELSEQVQEKIKTPVEKDSREFHFDKIVSTGSTLLDLCISGKRRRGGGIPGGLIMEIFGPPGSGKTAILSEIGASSQARNGQVMFLDPEARLDQEYARIYGIRLDVKDYFRPNTVTEVFEKIYTWNPEGLGVNVVATDSLAALSTDLELEKGDKMGMRRAKEFSEGLRKTARIISNSGWIIACSNQVRDGEYGETTPGGQAIPFYSSIRIRVSSVNKIEQRKAINGREVKKIIGIESKCFIRKSTVDDPFRECPLSIVFGYGVDSIRDELQYLKTMKGDTTYICPDGKSYVSLDRAISYVEENGLQEKLKTSVIDLWEEIEKKFESNRPRKAR